MLRTCSVALALALAACGGQSDEEALKDAAEQSDPAAAAVLNQAAEAGIDPQNALEAAGRAQAQTDVQPNSTVQARPNSVQNPNRPDGTRPPEKVDVATNNAAHEGH